LKLFVVVVSAPPAVPRLARDVAKNIHVVAAALVLLLSAISFR
jgi:hypothetical protein